MPKRKSVRELGAHREALEEALEVYLANGEPFYRTVPLGQRYAYTLKGVITALAEASFRSIDGPDQIVIAATESGARVIRIYSHGCELRDA